VTLYLGDCLEAAAEYWLAADVLVTDPPYGMAYQSNFAKGCPSAPIAGDTTTTARDRALELWGAERAALVFGTWRVPRPADVRQLLVWDKGATPGMGDLSLPWGPSHEDIYAMGRTGHAGKRTGSVLRVPGLGAMSADRPDHPTPKPVPLMEMLIGRTVGVVADPFSGGGSTLLAARNLGRRAVGVELEERYCEGIARRLASAPLPLHVPDPDPVPRSAPAAFDLFPTTTEENS